MVEIKVLKELSRSFSVLIVDDEEEFLSSFGAVAKKLFKTCYFAKNGEEALILWHQKRDEIDIIITDINMPKKNGISLIEDVRSESHTLPILVISAHSEIRYFKELINLSVDGFILKPIEETQLLRLLYKICKNLFDELLTKKYQEDIEKYLDTLIDKNIYFSKLTGLFKRFADGLDEDTRKNAANKIKKDEPEWELLIEFICTNKKESKPQITPPSVSFGGGKIGAREYLDRIEFDKYFVDTFEDIMTLGEYASEIYDLLEQHLDESCFSKLAVLFEKYSSLLVMFTEFSSLSNSVSCVSRFFSENSFEYVKEKMDLKQLAQLTRCFVVDLENWKDSVFIQKSARDIHYLDAQAESFSGTIESFLKGGDEEDEEIIFF